MGWMGPTLSNDRARELLGRIAAGDRDAYAEIVAGHQDALRASLGFYARTAQELEDFCHLAFVETYFRLADYRPERGAFLPWLLAVARNLVLEELRRRKSEGRRLFRYAERAAQEGPVHADVERARGALERCLAEVAPAEAAILRAHYRDGRTSEEIAGGLGKSAPAVRKTLQRLRERLRACVERRMVALEEAGP
jgi:RNA polymerase sigma-70 factor (ECF subfamily)